MINAVLPLAFLAFAPFVEPTTVSAPPPPQSASAQPPVRLRIRVEDAPDDFDPRLRRALVPHGIEPSESQRDGSLVVTIRPWDGGRVEGFGYDLDLARDGERVGDVFSQVCVGCSVQDLAVEVAAHVAEMAEALPPPVVLEPELPKTETLAPTLPPPSPAAPRGSVARPLLASGIPGVVAGCTMLGIGLGLLARGQVVELSMNDDRFLEVTDYRPTGVAFAISGGVVLAIGAVLTGVGGYQLRRDRQRQALRAGSRMTFRASVPRVGFSAHR